MEKVTQRYQMAVQTLHTLKEVLDKIAKGVPDEYYEELRDSAIQRFEYSIDTLWKFLKIHMQDNLKMNIETASPKGVIRYALDAAIIDQNEFELLLRCITSRNETSHAYNIVLAEEIFDNLSHFYSVMYAVISKIKM